MPTNRPTFPGTYTTVVDRSAGGAPRSSRYHVALVGPAEKGPFNTPTPVRSQREFTRIFGGSLRYSYLANAANIVAGLSDGATVVRVGQTYTPVCQVGSGAKNDTKVVTVGFAERFTPNDYVRVRQIGKATTLARLSSSAISDPDLPFANGGKLADDYTGVATVSRSPVPDAANEAEGFLYGTDWTPVADAVAASLNPSSSGYDPTVGVKNFFKFSLIGNGPTELATARSTILGARTIRISKAGLATTRETRVLSIEPVQTGRNDALVTLETVNNLQYGTQSVPLQDTLGYTYGTGASIQVKSGNTKKVFHMLAKSPGTWANSDGKATGVWVTVSPGSGPDSKKITIYEGGAAAEVYDNLNCNPASVDFIITRLATSALVTFKVVGQMAVTSIARDQSVVTVSFGASHSLSVGDWVTFEGSDLPEVNGSFQVTQVPSSTSITFVVENYTTNSASSLNEDYTQAIKTLDLLPANTIQGWDSGVTTVNFSTFSGGSNGELVDDTSYIGSIDPDTGVGTGLCSLEDTDHVNVDVIWTSPIRYAGTGVAVWQKMAQVCRVQNASGLVDADKGLTPREAVDYSNAAGKFASRVKLDNYSLSFHAGWWKVIDPTTKVPRWVPPSIARLRAQAFTYDNFGPWFASAGETRGAIPECLEVEFKSMTQATKDAIYGGGQVVNVILSHFDTYALWGNITTQRTDTRLTEDQAVHCVNFVMKSLAGIARSYAFDPNDTELLNHLDMDMRSELRALKDTKRAIEDFVLQIDSKNNTAEVRQRREVIVNLEFIPQSVAERFFINATLRPSGATLNSLSGLSA